MKIFRLFFANKRTWVMLFGMFFCVTAALILHSISTTTKTRLATAPAPAQHQPANNIVPVDAEPPVPIPEPKVPILMYHSVLSGTGLHVPVTQFDQEMNWLKSHGYQTITLGHLGDYWAGKLRVVGKPVVITFDDGYEDNYTNAWPILQKYQFQATIFVITDSIEKRKNHMTWAQMKEMQRGGIEFGSHTVHHLNFKTTSLQDLKWELTESKRVLEQGLGVSVTTFAYPGGGLIPQGPDLLKAAGYQMAVTTAPAFASQVQNPELLSRLRVVGGMNIDRFAALFQPNQQQNRMKINE